MGWLRSGSSGGRQECIVDSWLCSGWIPARMSLFAVFLRELILIELHTLLRVPPPTANRTGSHDSGLDALT